MDIEYNIWFKSGMLFHFIFISFISATFHFFSQTNTNEEYKFQIHNLNQIYK